MTALCNASECPVQARYQCSGCQQARYCSARCQHAHWYGDGGHAAECAVLATLLDAVVVRPGAAETLRVGVTRRDGRNVYVVQGQVQPTLELRVGTRYLFDLGDAEVQRGAHPLFMTRSARGGMAGRPQRLRTGDRGPEILRAGRYEFTPTAADARGGPVYYGCWNHELMGGLVRVAVV